MRLFASLSGSILALAMITSTVATAPRPTAGPIPPGKQHRLTISGENTITFIPQANVPPFQIDYKAKIEYIVDTRFGKETKPAAAAVSTTDEPANDDPATATEKLDEKSPTEKIGAKSKSTSTSRTKTKTQKAESPASKFNGAVDLSLHSTEMTLRQAGQPVMETKINRSMFQGRIQPESPVMSVTVSDAPPRLQEILKTFDTIAATMAINEDFKVMGRKFRFDGPQRAVTETILSIHAPIPKGVDSWESPTQLAMGHGQTAKGKLRFEKDNTNANPDPDPGKSSDIVKVKVSGVLKAEGAIAGRFIKDGTYTVTGDQTYDSHNHQWIASNWSVVVVNELANPNGQTVAHSKGTMTVRSTALDDKGAPVADPSVPKL